MVDLIREYRPIKFGWCIKVYCGRVNLPSNAYSDEKETSTMLLLIDNYFIRIDVWITNHVNWTSCYCMFRISLLHLDSSE